MPNYGRFIWKTVPVLRVLLPFAAGILIQYYCNFQFRYIFVLFVFGLLIYSLFVILKPSQKFILGWISGISLSLLFISIGSGLILLKNAKLQPQWIGNYLKAKTPVLLTVKEPLIEKAKSYKCLASADFVFFNGQWTTVKGNLLVYFKKDSTRPNIVSGSKILVEKVIEPIANTGNPGSFNYQQYCEFQNIYGQIFLQQKEYSILKSQKQFSFSECLVNARIMVLSILRKNIQDPDELGIAEALLIGYRDDIDKDLVQAYSNTGVVHIIAISGLHIAMIYGLIVLLFKPLQRFKWAKVLKPVVIILVIWGFTFLAGAVPSILRSAVMFSFIVLGENLGKRINIYNNLAASAFVILLFNPYSLWDVGFQLSYAAVLSIVIFSKSINNLVYLKNKLLKLLWNLSAVTISAQILTLPIILYNFHQFPNFFILTNLFVVPFSGLILYAEILLLVLSPFSTIAAFIGKLTGSCIALMNHFIERISIIPFASWRSIQITILQEMILYLFIMVFVWWLVHKQTKALLIALSCLVAFFGLRSYDFMQRNDQQKMIVYNISQHQAIDIIDGRKYQFLGDSILMEDGFLRNFHLNGSRMLHRVIAADSLNSIICKNNVIISASKNILVIDKPVYASFAPKKIKIDVIVISKNPRLYIKQLADVFDCDQYVFDASNPLWKINKWKKDCENLHLRHYSIPEQGAFVMDL